MRSTEMISKNVFIKIMVVFLAILFLYVPTRAKAEEIRVMTRNLYLGAEIQSIAAASTPEAFYEGVQSALEQIADNDFTERAEALAAEIVEKNPHLVGLQEVYNFTINGSNGPLPFHDYLAILTDMLAIQGAGYRVAAEVNNLDLTIPMPDGGSVGVKDRDVILAREDVDTQNVDLTADGLFRASLDGCNYSVFASAQTPIGTINFERGVVAVDAVIGTFPVRFFNTHLEVRDVDPTNPLSPLIQAAQAFELIAFLNLSNDENLPVIVVGDLNSSPEHMPVVSSIFTPYMQLVEAGYVDVWTLRPGNPKGFTCCQAENLLNPESILYERVDMIFCSELPVNKVQANLVGNDEAYKTPSGLWPSDHAGVVAKMEFAP